jgi:hypothetical protein
MALQAAPADNWPNLIAPDGSLQGVHPDDVAAALGAGYQHATPEQVQQHYQEQQYGTVGQQAATVAEGLARGVAGPLATQAEISSGITTPEAIKARQEVNPGEAGLSEVAGLTGSSLTGVGEGALLSKVGELAKGAVAAGDALRSTSIAGKLGAAAVQGAAENVLCGVGNNVNESLLGDHEALGEKLLPTVGLNALIGGAGGAALSALGMGAGKLASLADKAELSPDTAVKKIVGHVAGVDSDTISDYLKNREAVNSVPDYEDVSNHGLIHLEQLHSDLGTAKEGYQALESGMKEDLRQRGYDAQTASRTAKTALREAQEKLAGDTLNGALEAAPSVSNSVQTLRKHVMEGSQQAYDALEQSGRSVDLNPTYQKAKEMADGLRQQGTLEANAQADRIEAQIRTMDATYPGGIAPAPAVKSLIKGLDGISQWSVGNSADANNLAKQFRQIRHTLDASLKEQVPEYAAAMKPVARDAQLLDSVDHYTDPADAARNIKSLTNPVKYKYEMPALKQLEARVGSPITEGIEKYANPELRSAMESSLPEAKAAREAAAFAEELKNPETKRALAAQLHESPEFKALMEAQNKASALKGVSPAGLQSKLNKALSGSSIEARKLMEQIPGMEGKTMPEILDALRVKQAFEKGITNGSRNVNAAGAIGAFIGSFLHGVSPLAGYAGAAAGAAAGHVIDKNGPAFAKKLIDAYADNQSKLSALSSLSRAATSVSNKIASGAKRIFSDSGPAVASVAAKWDYDKVSKLLKNYNGDFNSAVGDTTARTKHMQKVAPNTAGALQNRTATAASFLQSKLPVTPPPTPFQPSLRPSQADIAKFKQYYDTVSNPTHVLDRVRQGTVTAPEIETLQTVYPKMYAEMKQQVYAQMIDATNKGKMVPYRTRIGVSLFMGAPLDSTMTPASIVAAQPAPTQAPQPPQQGKKVTQHGGDKLAKMGKSYETKSQAAEKDQISRD